MPFLTPKTFETLAKNAVRDSRSELFLSVAGTDSVKRQTRPSQAKKKVSSKLYYYCRNSKFKGGRGSSLAVVINGLETRGKVVTLLL